MFEQALNFLARSAPSHLRKVEFQVEIDYPRQLEHIPWDKIEAAFTSTTFSRLKQLRFVIHKKQFTGFVDLIREKLPKCVSKGILDVEIRCFPLGRPGYHV